ncbi:hypothetical protein [Pacificoceanicola onchidii]|uniref:hypothetical protein n=1 Tax=Pacificoceanicola onchidii TaxID=2562685 RepID=UPI0014560AD3|nr:hypothetical protein [Pacificoceanicola onchidii]
MPNPSQCRYFPISTDLAYLTRHGHGPLDDASQRAKMYWAKAGELGLIWDHSADPFIRSPKEIPNKQAPRLTVELSNKRTPLPDFLNITSNGLIFIRPGWSDSLDGLPIDSLAWPPALFQIAFQSSSDSRLCSYVAGLPYLGWQENLAQHTGIDWGKSRFCRVKALSLMRDDKPVQRAVEDLSFANGQDAEDYLEKNEGGRTSDRILRILYPQALALKLKAFPAFFQFETKLFVSEEIARSRRGKAPFGMEVYEQNGFVAELAS